MERPTALFNLPERFNIFDILPRSNTDGAPLSQVEKEKTNQTQIHRLFKKDVPSQEELRDSAEVALLKTNLTPEAQEARTVLKKIDCFQSLANYCNAVHDILVEQRGKLDHAGLYELAVKAVAHIDKIGQNLVSAIMPQSFYEMRVFAEEMAVHFFNLPWDLAKHRKPA
jgi:hypothetical protein